MSDRVPRFAARLTMRDAFHISERSVAAVVAAGYEGDTSPSGGIG